MTLATTTVGIVDWVGETVTNSIGAPIYFHELVRFESDTQAISYVSSYVSTVNCDIWNVPADDGSGDIPFAVSVEQPTATWGDDTRAIGYNAEAEGVTLGGRMLIVRKGTDVYMVSVISFQDSHVAALDEQMGVAVGRLGF